MFTDVEKQYICCVTDPRIVQFARGRSINLALSNRARKALQKVGIERKILKSGVPIKGRFIHNLNGKNKSLEFDPRTKQVHLKYTVTTHNVMKK